MASYAAIRLIKIFFGGQSYRENIVPQQKWLTSIRDEHIAFTGKAWRDRKELKSLVRQRGGIVSSDHVTEATTVLVRGESKLWAYGEYGLKEKKAEQLIRDGHNIYLVHDFEFRKLLEDSGRARVSDYVAGQPVKWLQFVGQKQFKISAEIDGPLDREHSVKGRVEQSYLRRLLFGSADEAKCAICGRSLPLALMVAAHIKPRSDCTRTERLDAPHIVIALCALGCDALYERGLIAVKDGGVVVTSNAYNSKAVQAVLRSLKGKKCHEWCSSNADYFDWHLKRRFLG